jgi:molybdopterin-guanine dinucleotide biosynthesis protein A
MKRYVFILAGGKSKRFGSNKAFAKIESDTFLERIIKTIYESSSSPILSVRERKGEWESFSLPFVEDIVKDKGICGGIYSCMINYELDYYFFLPVDNPFVSVKYISFMHNLALKYRDKLTKGEIYALIPVYKEKWYPTMGIYTRWLLPFLEEEIQKDKPRIKKILILYEKKILLLTNNWKNLGISDKNFSNINTPSEYNKLLFS